MPRIVRGALVQATWTGFPAAFTRRAAWTAWRLRLLPPKPPPTKGMITWTFAAGIPRVWAISSFRRNGACVEAQTVAFPSLSSTMAAWGSMGAWAT